MKQVLEERMERDPDVIIIAPLRWFLVPTPKHSSNTCHLIELHVELLEEPPACVNLISLCVTWLQKISINKNMMK